MNIIINIIRKWLGLVPRLKRSQLKQCFTGKQGLLNYEEHRRIHNHFKQNIKGSNHL